MALKYETLTGALFELLKKVMILEVAPLKEYVLKILWDVHFMYQEENSSAFLSQFLSSSSVLMQQTSVFGMARLLLHGGITKEVTESWVYT